MVMAYRGLFVGSIGCQRRPRYPTSKGADNFLTLLFRRLSIPTKIGILPAWLVT